MKKMFLQGLLTTAILAVGAIAATACGGSSGTAIDVVSREDGSGTRGAFIEVLGILQDGSDMTYAGAEIAPGTSQVINSVAGNSNAIGYISLGSLNDSVSAVNVNGVAPTPANVRSGAYPLFRAFWLTVQPEVNEITQEFLNFMLSAEGQAIAANNYIPANDNASAFVATEGLSGTVVVAGSTSVAPLVNRLADAFMAVTDITVEVHSQGSTAGIVASIEGTADIGMSSRDLNANELTQINGITLALDGLAVIVHNDSEVTNLQQDMIRRIFIGEVTNWSDVN